jgi:hypothetical protein
MWWLYVHACNTGIWTAITGVAGEVDHVSRELDPIMAFYMQQRAHVGLRWIQTNYVPDDLPDAAAKQMGLVQFRGTQPLGCTFGHSGVTKGK